MVTMAKVSKKKFTVKKSSGEQSPKLLKTLTKIINSKHGSINFVFISKRISNIHSNNINDMKEIEVKSFQNLKLTRHALEGKKPNDLIWMAECIRNDIGADRFEFN